MTKGRPRGPGSTRNPRLVNFSLFEPDVKMFEELSKFYGMGKSQMLSMIIVNTHARMFPGGGRERGEGTGE